MTRSLRAIMTHRRSYLSTVRWLLPWVGIIVLPIAASLSGSSTAIKNIVVVGGTHGNEYTGVWCIKQLEARPDQLEVYPSLNIKTLLGNPQAHMENKRFIDSDLNREFSESKLQSNQEATVESRRARLIDTLLGPKFGGQPATDLIVDLHSTTSNMGVTLIVPEGDVCMARAAAYVMHKCPFAQVVMHAIPNRDHRPNLSSTARHGFTIEVGPVPQGVLRHDFVEKTQEAMHSLFEYLEAYNEGKDDDVLQQLENIYPFGLVPCYRSAKAKRPGEMSGKIPWPCSADNPNFPSVMIHKSLQDRDFELISTGDPLFVTLDGDIIHYDGSHGDQVYLMFVNEGGYYYESSGTGIGVAVKTEYDMKTGLFVEECSVNEAEECMDSFE